MSIACLKERNQVPAGTSSGERSETKRVDLESYEVRPLAAIPVSVAYYRMTVVPESGLLVTWLTDKIRRFTRQDIVHVTCGGSGAKLEFKRVRGRLLESADRPDLGSGGVTPVRVRASHRPLVGGHLPRR